MSGSIVYLISLELWVNYENNEITISLYIPQCTHLVLRYGWAYENTSSGVASLDRLLTNMLRMDEQVEEASSVLNFAQREL